MSSLIIAYWIVNISLQRKKERKKVKELEVERKRKQTEIWTNNQLQLGKYAINPI